MSKFDFEIVIVGGGLVGATLAALIAKRIPHWRIAMIDSNSPSPLGDSRFDSRVIALGDQGYDLFRELGIWAALEDHTCAYEQMVVWDAEGTGRIRFAADELELSQLGHTVENSRLQLALWQFLREQANVELICPARLVNLSVNSNDPDSAGARIDVDEDGRSLSIETQLVCAVDGAMSPIRKLLEIPTVEWSYHQSALVGTIEVENPHQQTCWQRFIQTGPLAFLPLQSETDRHCSIVWTMDEDRLDEIKDLSNEQLCERLTMESEQILGRVISIEGRAQFPLSQRHAQQYCQASVVLVGDSAHTIHPLAGQGANLGFQDVEALVEELQRAAHRQLSPGDLTVLKRYQRRRKTENLAMIAAMEGFKRLFGSDSIHLRWLRNRGLAQVDQMPDLKRLFIQRASKPDAGISAANN